MHHETITYISTKRGSELLKMDQGGLRKILRYETPDGKKKLESTKFIVDKKPRFFIKKTDFLEFIRREIKRFQKHIDFLKQSEQILEEELRRGC